jgi:hypothetical protein
VAVSASGKEGVLRNSHNLLTRLATSVSRLYSALSLDRRISVGEKRVKTSSADSGRSQNYNPISKVRIALHLYLHLASIRRLAGCA